jgi:hypothetical protein
MNRILLNTGGNKYRGVEQAVNYLRTKKMKEDIIRLNILLPTGQINHDLKEKTAEALSSYCDFKISQNLLRLKIERAEGVRTVLIGLIFCGICLLLASLVHFLGSLSDTLLVAFTGIFTILIWMAIWTPAATFVYGLQPYRLEIKIIKL